MLRKNQKHRKKLVSYAGKEITPDDAGKEITPDEQ